MGLAAPSSSLPTAGVPVGVSYELGGVAFQVVPEFLTDAQTTSGRSGPSNGRAAVGALARAAQPCGTSPVTSRGGCTAPRRRLLQAGEASASLWSARSRCAHRSISRSSSRSSTRASSAAGAIGDLYRAVLVTGTERDRLLKRCVQRTAPAERTPRSCTRERNRSSSVLAMCARLANAAPSAAAVSSSASPGRSSPRDPRVAAETRGSAAAPRGGRLRPARPPRPFASSRRRAARRATAPPALVFRDHMGVDNTHVAVGLAQAPLPVPQAPRDEHRRRACTRIDRGQQKTPCLRFVAASYKSSPTTSRAVGGADRLLRFVSLFPLLLVFVTILGFVLEGHPERPGKNRRRHARAVPGPRRLTRSPGAQRQRASRSRSASRHAPRRPGRDERSAERVQRNLGTCPYKSRPNFIVSRLRSLGMLAILGTLDGHLDRRSRLRRLEPPRRARAVIAGVLVAFACNVVLFMTAFKLLTAADVSWREYLPGVITAAVLWQLLQHLGGYYVDHTLNRRSRSTARSPSCSACSPGCTSAHSSSSSPPRSTSCARGKLWPRSFFS